jgi:hypothetical protein
MTFRSTPRLARALLLVATPFTAALFAGCAGTSSTGDAPTASAVTLQPPPAGSAAWQVISNGGEKKFGATVPEATPWITVTSDGTLRAKVPASAETQAAKAGLDPQTMGAVTIRRAP